MVRRVYYVISRVYSYVDRRTDQFKLDSSVKFVNLVLPFTLK